ncbi:MAG TPA: hypothetical protein VLQ79_11810, partial [Myxococcaceae bacterium]|nr:hypothetical protein [Myxococcaceae bacterium]
GCVPASSVMTSKKVDWDKVRRARIEGVLVGGLSKSKRPQILEVSFLNPDAQRAYRTRVTIVNGRISSSQLVEIRDGVAAALRAARAPVAAAPPVPTTRPGPAAAPGTAATPPAPGVPPPPGEIAPPPPGEIAPPPPGTDIAPPAAGAFAESESEAKPELVTAELAVQLVHRSWSYTGQLVPGGLRTYSLSLFTEPRALVGVYPLRSAEGILSAAGLELSGAVAIGPVLAGADPSAPKCPVSLWWLDGGARVWLRLGSWRLGPAVGFRKWHQSVQPNSQGLQLDGVPTVDATAVRLGLGIDGPIAGAFGLTAELSYFLVLSAGLDTTLFPGASAGPCFEGRLDFTWQATRSLRLFLGGTFSRESYNLKGAGGAEGAQATVFGGELGFRLGL